MILKGFFNLAFLSSKKDLFEIRLCIVSFLIPLVLLYLFYFWVKWVKIVLTHKTVDILDLCDGRKYRVQKVY